MKTRHTVQYCIFETGLIAKFRQNGLSDHSSVVMLELLTYWNKETDNDIFPSVASLAIATGNSDRKVQRALKEIFESKLLVPVSGGVGKEPRHWKTTERLRLIVQSF